MRTAVLILLSTAIRRLFAVKMKWPVFLLVTFCMTGHEGNSHEK